MLRHRFYTLIASAGMLCSSVAFGQDGSPVPPVDVESTSPSDVLVEMDVETAQGLPSVAI
ncbi:MAG: hypothetical protein ACI9G1_003685, partial [Pirellulaceae bacterium]